MNERAIQLERWSSNEQSRSSEAGSSNLDLVPLHLVLSLLTASNARGPARCDTRVHQRKLADLAISTLHMCRRNTVQAISIRHFPTTIATVLQRNFYFIPRIYHHFSMVFWIIAICRHIDVISTLMTNPRTYPLRFPFSYSRRAIGYSRLIETLLIIREILDEQMVNALIQIHRFYYFYNAARVANTIE